VVAAPGREETLAMAVVGIGSDMFAAAVVEADSAAAVAAAAAEVGSRPVWAESASS
jgi:hypothetical protein